MTHNELKLFNIEWNSISDGPGNRVVVFLQGCNLMCDWCHSPHSRNFKSPLLFFSSLCSLCGECAIACPNGVHTVTNSGHYINREICAVCSLCVDACPLSSRSKGGALVLPTKRITVCDLYSHIEPQLKMFQGNGGITFSGGEPLLQAESLLAMIQLCKDNHHNVALETSASVSGLAVDAIIPLIDTWLIGLNFFDFKKQSPNKSIEIKTKSLLSKVKKISKDNIIIRLPAVPGYTDNILFLEQVRLLMNEFDISSVEVLPFNPITNHFYIASGLKYKIEYSKELAQHAFSTINKYFIKQNYLVS